MDEATKEQMGLFQDDNVSLAKNKASKKLDTDLKELRGDRKETFDKMTEMLTSGKVNDMSIEEKKKFVTLYKMLKKHHNFSEGGLEQDGGTVDPISGNDVPVGSTQEEVRDDIPAQLSEGEFVFPADVVRFIGLNNLMQIRQEAKAGLKKMEAMGQMGNSDEATMPDDIPFTADDITVEDDDGNEGDLEMNVGGVVYQPSQVGSQFNIAPQQQQPVFQPMPMPQMPQQQTGYMPSFAMQPQQPQQYTGFQSLIPMPTQKYENVSYINKTTGETMVIPHVGGKPVFDPPEGFTRIKAGEEAPKEDTKVDETLDTSVPTATVTKPYDKEGDSTSPENMKKAAENRLNSYSSMVSSALEQSPDKSKEGITKFIKEGNVKGNLFGFEFKIPGITFTEEDIAKAYDNLGPSVSDDATGKFSVTPISTDDAGKVIKKDEDVDKATKPKIRTSSIDEGTAGEAEARKAFLEAEANRKKAELAKQIQKAEADARRKAEAEADARRKAEAEAKEKKRRAAETARLKAMAEAEQRRRDEAEETRKKAREERAQASREKRVGGRGIVRAKGGLASKPEKKTMKRGGLASKK